MTRGKLSHEEMNRQKNFIVNVLLKLFLARLLQRVTSELKGKFENDQLP